MDEDLRRAVAVLDDLEPTVTWSDVERAAASAGRSGAPQRQMRRASRGVLVAASVAVLMSAAVALAAISWPGGGERVRSGPPDADPTGVELPTSSVTVQPAPDGGGSIGGWWSGSVRVWTGAEYLVWGGSERDGAPSRSDGWRYVPETGEVERIAAAPISGRHDAGGVWTGTELIVCCGATYDQGATREGGAAAYDPTTNTWRTLRAPPVDAAGAVVGGGWTGTEMLVAVDQSDPASRTANGLGLFAYDPGTDRWSERARPPVGDRFATAVWGNGRLAVWGPSGRSVVDDRNVGHDYDHGATYDPGTDTWTMLPPQPLDAPVEGGDPAWVGDQLIVWGLQATDNTNAQGYRIRIGDDAWRGVAPAPIAPYEGTEGSGSLAPDEERSRLIVYPVYGNEHGGGATGVPPPDLLAYDPAADRWEVLGPFPQDRYAPEITVAGDRVVWPDADQPLVRIVD